MAEFNTELCNERHKNIDEKLDKILTHMEGNGKPGVINRLTTVETRLNETDKTEAARKGFYSFLAKNWLVLLVLLVMLFNFFKGDRPFDIEEIAAQVAKIKSIAP